MRLLIAALYGLMLLGSCEDKKEVIPPVISFTEELEIVTEGETATISLTLDRPAVDNVSIRLTIETDAVYGQHYRTNPSLSSGVISVNILKGVLNVNLQIQTFEDSRYEGTRFIVFTINDHSGSVDLGETTTLTLTIYDNEGPSVANFTNVTAQLKEEASEGVMVRLPFSSPAKGEGSITIGVVSDKAIYDTHFNIDRDIVNSSIAMNVVSGDTGVSFQVYPINNDLFTGDLDLRFSITDVSGVVQKGAVDDYALTLVDDELPTLVRFSETSRTIDETYATPIPVDLVLSSPVKGEGVLRITFPPDSAVYGVDFSTTPAAEHGVIEFRLSHNETRAGFRVSVFNDDSVGGNLMIPFWIAEGSGPLSPASDDRRYTLTIVDDEKPSLVNFRSSSAEIDESDAEGLDIALTLSSPALHAGTIVLDVAGHNEKIVTDPAMEDVYVSSSYSGTYYKRITLDVEKGAERAEVNVLPIDDTQCVGNSHVVLSIASVTGPLAIGNVHEKFDVFVKENEPHIAAELKTTRDTLKENANSGQKVVVDFLSPAARSGSINVYLDYNTNFYGGRFSTIPEFIVHSSSGYMYGILEYPAMATGVSFEILPVNDSKENGNFTEVFYFSNGAQSECMVMPENEYTLIFADDD